MSELTSELRSTEEGLRPPPVPSPVTPRAFAPGALEADNILSLQQSSGNQAVARYLAAQRNGGVRPTVGTPVKPASGGLLLRDNGGSAPAGQNAAAQHPLAATAQNNAHLIRNRANMRL